MKQTTIYDFLNELDEHIRCLEAERDAEVDETPTNVDLPDEGQTSKPNLPILEQVIVNYLAALEPGTLPGLEQAQVIALFDQILRESNY
jgi:hypothetical protein